MVGVFRHLVSKLIKSRYSVVDVIAYSIVFAAAIGIVVRWRETRVFQALGAGQLPDVKVGVDPSAKIAPAFRGSYRFTSDWFTRNVAVWSKVLESYKAKPDIRYLEIGVYEGRSLLWMLENVLTHSTARATAVDPLDGSYKETFLANLKQSGSGDKVTTDSRFSQVALRQQPLECYDIIYVDGSHERDDLLEDAVLCWRLLKPTGIIIFDDYRWYESPFQDCGTADPRIALDAFMKCFGHHFAVIHNGYQLILRKST
jgi:hypothetical protein